MWSLATGTAVIRNGAVLAALACKCVSWADSAIDMPFPHYKAKLPVHP